MKKFLDQVLLFTAIVACSMAVSFTVVTFAHADIVLTPPSGQASAYLASHGVLPTLAGSWYPEVIAADGTTCRFNGATNDSDTYQIGVSGQFGGSNWSVYAPTQCTGGTEPDWSVDGDYIVNFWNEYGQITLLGTATFCQGDGCSVPPEPTPSLEATSTVDQTQQNAWNAFFAFLAIVFFMVWLGRSNK